MRQRAISRIEEIKRTRHPLINFFPIRSSIKKNIVFEDLSKSYLNINKKPAILLHIEAIAESEILQPIIKLFAQKGRYTIVLTIARSLSVEYDKLNNNKDIDFIFSLPTNTVSNAEALISLIKPIAAIFTSSDYCYNYLKQLNKRNIPVFLIAAKIKPSPLLKWQAATYANTLKSFTEIFVFDDKSKNILNQLDVASVRQYVHPPIDCELVNESDVKDSIIGNFISHNNFIFIGGNIDADKDLMSVVHLLNTNPTLKCILIPNTISEEILNKIKYDLDGYTLLYSECDENTDFRSVQTLVIDFIGYRSQIYRYGSCAYIGSGFTSNLNTILEATANGLPTAFGPKLKQKILPDYLIKFGIGQVVKSPQDLCKWKNNLESNQALLHRINFDSKQFVEMGIETTHRIYSCINGYL